jgi:hypothetical protein
MVSLLGSAKAERIRVNLHFNQFKVLKKMAGQSSRNQGVS